MTDEQDTSGASGFGRSLRRTRERLGLSVEDIASELRLSRFQVTALEKDDWDQLPGTTYARGYLRSYARLLGLDADQLLAGATTQEIEITRTEPKIGARGPGEDAPAPGTPTRLAWGWVSAVVLTGVLAVVYWQYREGGTLSPDTTGIEIAAMGSGSDLRSASAADADSGDRLAAAADAGAAGGAGASDVPPTPASQRVVFRFEQGSWIDVRDAHGERLLYRSVQPGRRIAVEGHPPFSVFLGNARAVQVEYMGRTVAPRTVSGRLYARFVLGSPSG